MLIRKNFSQYLVLLCSRFDFYGSCDVSSRDNVLEVAKKVQEEVGDVSILINNAGIMPTHSLHDHTHEEIERIMGINVFAHFWVKQNAKKYFSRLHINYLPDYRSVFASDEEKQSRTHRGFVIVCRTRWDTKSRPVLRDQVRSLRTYGSFTRGT